MAKRGTSLKEKRSAKALRATRRAEAKAKGIAPKAVLPPPAKPNVPPTKPKPKPVPVAVVGADGLTLKQRIQKRNREKAQAEKATEAKKAKKAEKKGK